MESVPFNVPESIETGRLVLRVPDVADAATLTATVLGSLEELARWMPWAHEAYGEVEGDAWVRRARSRYLLREEAPFILFDRASGEHVGNLGAFKIDQQIRSCEIGYWLRTDRVGHGLMTEAVNALCGTLVDGMRMRRIEIRCDDENVRSAATALRCGFELEETYRFASTDRAGNPRSTRVYAKIVSPTA